MEGNAVVIVGINTGLILQNVPRPSLKYLGKHERSSVLWILFGKKSLLLIEPDIIAAL
jgi:hypothetical protein